MKNAHPDVSLSLKSAHWLFILHPPRRNFDRMGNASHPKSFRGFEEGKSNSQTGYVPGTPAWIFGENPLYNLHYIWSACWNCGMAGH
jgi:hypothetical protein